MRKKITLELVAQLAQELIAKGETPTNTSIRERNGDYGSPNDISKYLKIWRKEQADKLQKQEESLLRPMPDNINEVLKPVWNAMVRELYKDIDDLKVRHSADIAEKDKLIEEYDGILKKLTQERDQLEQRCDDYQQNKVLLTEDLEKAKKKLTDEIARHTEKQVSYDKQAEKLKETDTRLNEVCIEAALQSDRVKERDKIIKELKPYQSLYDKAQGKIKEYDDILKKLTQERDQLEQRCDGYHQDKIRLAEGLEEVKKKLTDEIARHTELQISYDEQDQKIKTLDTKLHEVRIQEVLQSDRVEERDKIIKELKPYQSLYDKAQGQIEELREALKKYENDTEKVSQ